MSKWEAIIDLVRVVLLFVILMLWAFDQVSFESALILIIFAATHILFDISSTLRSIRSNLDG